jgi:integrase
MWLTLNPARSIKKPKVGVGKTRFFNQEEVHKIKDFCSKSESLFLLPIFTIALYTGMRKGEILNLRWENIDLKNKEICLPTSKNGEPRDIPMTAEVVSSLSEIAHAKQIAISDLIFPSPYNPQRPIDIRSAWNRVLQKAGIHDATFHTIRHTTCSYLAQAGIPRIFIARIVGHKDSRTTDRYTHAEKTYVREAIDKLEVLIQGDS